MLSLGLRPFSVVPQPLRCLLSYPAARMGLIKEPRYKQLDMVQAAIRISLAAAVLFTVLPLFTSPYALIGLAYGGTLLSSPVTALVGGSVLLKASYAAFMGAYTLSKVALLGNAIVLGSAGYLLIHNYNYFCIHYRDNVPELLERGLVGPLTIRLDSFFKSV